MCEKFPFWRWLVQVLVGAVRGMPRGLVWAIRAVPGMVGAIKMPRITTTIRNPFCEFYTGLTAMFMFPMWAILTSDLALDMRIVLALLSLPSFLIMMHGLYRGERDC